ncbi:MAG: 5'/3'-nucleotidase SurE [Candidatus Kapabacteria bacterium]|nr:5'/3'-nucleotidase SurE [Candidatus Kapabacteria bacterium]
MNILVSNDDGIDSLGIVSLVRALKPLGKVTVVAPDRQQSAVGHSLTFSSPLRATPFHRDGEILGYSINGTPCDCVKLALSTLLDEKPDMVISGINHGANTAINILYSGTVSAATEGMLSGIPSMAVSVNSHDNNADFSSAMHYSYLLAKNLLNLNMPKDTFLNVNIPALPLESIKGIKTVEHNSSLWKDEYIERFDPFGQKYYWFSGKYEVFNSNVDVDDILLEEDYVTITPVQYNLTNKVFLKNIKHLEEL